MFKTYGIIYRTGMQMCDFAYTKKNDYEMQDEMVGCILVLKNIFFLYVLIILFTCVLQTDLSVICFFGRLFNT